MELGELVAREGIRDAIARWNANGDARRLDAMVAVLAPDVEFEAPGTAPVRGRDAVLAYLGGVRDDAGAEGPVVEPRPPGPYVPPGGRPSIRHFTSTTTIQLTSPTTADVRTYYAVLSSHGLDHWGRYLDTFGLVDGEWLITRRVITMEGRDPDGWAASFA